MIGKTTIIVEDRLKEIFDFLPAIDSFQPVFKSGDEAELIAFFKQSQSKTNYPLIWLDMPYLEEHQNRSKVEVQGLILILAVETSPEMLNSERLELVYKPRLYPLLDNILDVFTVGNTLNYDSNFSISRFPNYSSEQNGDESGFVDLWDAIKLTIDVSINDNCLRTIKI